jgi:hypothetical protein
MCSYMSYVVQLFLLRYFVFSILSYIDINFYRKTVHFCIFEAQKQYKRFTSVLS